MEAILRKVKCSDRLPSESGNYSTDINKNLYFDEWSGNFWNKDNWKVHPEYWYEEVDLLEAFKAVYKMEFIDNAKKRYEKACSQVDNLLQQSFEGWSEDSINGYKTAMETTRHMLLKIAAGLEE